MELITISQITESIFNINETNTTMLLKYCEMEGRIEKLTGLTLRGLEGLLAAGWTLTPPEEPTSLLEAMAELAEDDA